jgi:hypothetical protein
VANKLRGVSSLALLFTAFNPAGHAISLDAIEYFDVEADKRAVQVPKRQWDR